MARDNFARNRRPLRRIVELGDAEFIGSTSGRDDQAANFLGGGRWDIRQRRSNRGAGEQLHIVRDMKDPRAKPLEVLVGLRGPKGPQNEATQVRLDAWAHWRDIRRAI